MFARLLPLLACLAAPLLAQPAPVKPHYNLATMSPEEIDRAAAGQPRLDFDLVPGGVVDAAGRTLTAADLPAYLREKAVNPAAFVFLWITPASPPLDTLAPTVKPFGEHGLTKIVIRHRPGAAAPAAAARPARLPHPDQTPEGRIGDEAMQQKDYARALTAYQASLAAHPEHRFTAHSLYNAACAAARLGQAELALAYLDRAFPASEEWPIDHRRLDKDADLEGLRGDARWTTLRARIDERAAAVQAGPLAAVKAELLLIHERDQAPRKQLAELEKAHGRNSPEMQAHWQRMAESDAANLAKVAAILEQHGWLGPKQVGPKASSALFLVIQHADLAAQQRYLPLMREAVKAGRAAGSSLALLEDRVALREGRPQIYGSQIGIHEDGTHYVLPLQDPAGVDIRRAAVGLPPLADYVSRWSIQWDPVVYLQQLPTLPNPFAPPPPAAPAAPSGK